MILAILEPLTLLGKEVRETLSSRPGTWHEFRLLTTREADIGGLSEVAGAAALVVRADADSLAGVDMIFCCGTAGEAEQTLQDLTPGTTVVVLTHELGNPAFGRPVVSGVSEALSPSDGGQVFLSPNPAVILLAHLLHPLRGLGIEEAIATVLQPASMEGEPGIDELFEQTSQILTMTARKPAPIFGAQLAFNLLPVPAPADGLAAQLFQVLAGDPPVSLQVLQSGVFHSMAVSLYLRFANRTDAKSLRRMLAAHPHIEVFKKPQHLGPIDAAAHDKILLGAIHEEPTPPGGFWLWATMDNLTRGGALNALEIAAAVL